MHGFVYIWFDKKHKRFYIGSHWGTEDDGYICSSSWMKQAYKRRPNDFKRKILITNIQNRVETFKTENYWLKFIKIEELGKKYYNLKNHDFNHWSANKDLSKKISNSVSKYMQSLSKEERSKKYGRHRKKTEEEKRKISESHKKIIANGYRPKCGIKGRSQTEYQKMRAREANLGKKHTEESKQKMREAKNKNGG